MGQDTGLSDSADMTGHPRCTRGACTLLGLIAATLLLGGCVLSPARMERVDQRVALGREQALSCKPEEAGRCAESSPLLTLAGNSLLSGHHYLNLLEVGEDALAIRIHLIRAARHTIELQSFILRPDQSGELLLNELLNAARRGVKVRLLLDQMFSGNDLDQLARLAMAHANFAIRFYNPSFNKARTDRRDWLSGVACCFVRFNQRMHNKALVVDDLISIVGGRNIADRYFDYDPIYNFKDREVVIYGSTSLEVRQSFDLFWEASKAVPLQHLRDVARRILAQPQPQPQAYSPPTRFLPLLSRIADERYIHERFIATLFAVERLDFFTDLPRKQAYPEAAAKRDITAELYQVLSSAQESVLTQSPYLVLSSDARRMFSKLRKRNPRIELVFSTNSLASTDTDSVYANTHKHKVRYVDKLGFSMYELKPYPLDAPEFFPRWSALIAEKKQGVRSRFALPEDGSVLEMPAPRTGLHCKTFVVDSHVVIIGSHNFDPRSEVFNTENGLIVWDEVFAAAVAQMIRRDTEPGNSWVVALKPPDDLPEPESYATFRAALQYEPRTYGATSAYELIPGKTPVKPGSPDFYRNYYPVGAFPQVTRTRRQFMVLFLGSFLGFLEPIY